MRAVAGKHGGDLGSANLSTKRQRIAELARTKAGTSSPPCGSRQASHGRRPLRQRERNSLVKNRMRETCTSGSVRGGDGNIPTYSAFELAQRRQKRRECIARGEIGLSCKELQLAGVEGGHEFFEEETAE